MEDKEKTAIQKSLLLLLDDLDPEHVTPYLFQYGYLKEIQYQELTNSNLTQHKLCKKFLNIITSKASCCTFSGFLSALRYRDAYSFIADKLEEQLRILNQNDVENGKHCENKDEKTFVKLTQGHRSPDSLVPGERPPGNSPHTGRLRDNCPQSAGTPLFENVKKIDVFHPNRPEIAELAHKLKRLSHDGDVDKFRRIVTKVDRIYKKHKLDTLKDIEDRMNFADMKFTALEAEASFKRVKYDVTLYENPLFKEMESMIPYTTNPRVSSMTYLARYGSAVSMLESLDSGLAILQYSEHHAEHVVPCKETGMVYYIKVNLLSQKYEKEPDSDLKMKILKTAELAMSQFTGEEDAVQKDYQRMLMLKMVFCRLGIGLFGNKIENVVSDDSDKDAAKDYLDFIERPAIWNGMEKRRKMLFQVAKSELYRQRQQYELALPHAKEAVRIAEENHWHAESPNFQKRLADLEDEMQAARSQPNASKGRDQWLDQWLDEFDDEDCSLEMEELKIDVHDNTANTTKRKEYSSFQSSPDYSLEMEELKIDVHDKTANTTKRIEYSSFQSSPDYSLEMEELKIDVQGNRANATENTDHSSFQSASSQNYSANEEQVQIDFLKEPCVGPVEVDNVNKVKMNNLKCFTGIQETCYNYETTSLLEK